MAAKTKKQKQKPSVKEEVKLPETRNALMILAKDKGIKNFRVLNKEELRQVLAEDVTVDEINQVVTSAVTRWKEGWGKRKENQ